MGSFNTTCGLTNSVISGGTNVVMLMLTRKNAYRAMPVYSWDLWAPIPILFEGTYDSYGSLSNTKIFQSKELLDEKKLSAVSNVLLQDFQSIMLNEKNAPLKDTKNLEELLSERNLVIAKKDPQVEAAKGLLQELEKNPELMQETFDVFLKFLGFKEKEEMQTFVKENEGAIKTIPISFMMFNKDIFIKFLNKYGVGYNDKDHYAPKIQKQRGKDIHSNSSPTLKEMMDVLNKPNSYAGTNRPEYTYEHAIKGIARKMENEKSDLIALSKLHAMDITLLNDYFTVLGKTFQPTMYVSEDVAYHGHKEAYALQQELLSYIK